MSEHLRKLSIEEKESCLLNLDSFQVYLEGWTVRHLHDDKFLEAQVLRSECKELIKKIQKDKQVELVAKGINTLFECLIHTLPHTEPFLFGHHPLRNLFQELAHIKKHKAAESFNKRNPHILPITAYDLTIDMNPRFIPQTAENQS